MKKRFLLALGVALAASISETSIPDLLAQESTIEVGERHSLHSAVLGEDRGYIVYVPDSYHEERYYPQAYPVLYLLDGGAHFHSASGVVQFMSAGVNGNMQAPEMIVVAIPNTNRMRDLTPTHTTTALDGSENPALRVSGGGEDFLRFIREELFPEIESRYRTRPYRVFVGHSLGGLTVLHALVAHPEMFQAHIAIDPSLWWDGEKLVRRAEDYFPAATDLTGAVYLTMANNPARVAGRPSQMRVTGEAFSAAMAENPSAGFRSASRFYEAEDHGSVPLISLYDGLLHVFDGYKPSLESFLEDPSRISEHFAAVSEQLGAEFLPPEPIVDRLGRLLVQRGDHELAIGFLETNAANYPDSWSAHSRLAAAYAAADRSAEAIGHYERSLELNPENDADRTRLARLKSN